MKADSTNNIVIFGAPGAGKGTHATRLKDFLGVPHISTGDMFRDHTKRKTRLGKIAEYHCSQGHLVPDDVTTEMVRERLSQEDVQNGFLLDGYPRSVPQAEALEQILKEKGTHLDVVLNVSVTNEESMKRILRRADIEGRKDDADPILIQERLHVYKRQTAPCLDYFRPKGLVVDIDGIGTINETYGRVLAVFTSGNKENESCTVE